MNLLTIFADVIDGDEIINQLFPNIPILIAHVISTIVLLLVLWRWVYNPFRKMLNARHQEIKSKIDEASSKQALANQDRSEAIARLNSAKEAADDIIISARSKAYDDRKEIIDKANEEAMRITNQSKRDLIRQRHEAEKQIRQEIEDISLEVAKKILAEEISSKKHQKLIDEFIDEF